MIEELRLEITEAKLKRTKLISTDEILNHITIISEIIQVYENIEKESQCNSKNVKKVLVVQKVDPK